MYAVICDGECWAAGFETEDAAWLFIAREQLDMVYGKVEVVAYEA